MAARFSQKSTISSLRTLSFVGTVLSALNMEVSPNWLLKNSLSECVYQNDENSLRRNMTEIKTYEEVYTGKMVFSVSKGGCMGARFSPYE